MFHFHPKGELETLVELLVLLLGFQWFAYRCRNDPSLFSDI